MILYALNSTNLRNLGIPYPKATIPEYDQILAMGDGSTKGHGWKRCEWRWAVIDRASVVALRSICSGRSASVTVQTLEEDGTYDTYTAVMNWPPKIPAKAEIFLDLVIEFTAMVEVGD